MTKTNEQKAHAVLAAIKPDFYSKAAYSGQISQMEQVTVILDDGTYIEKEINVLLSWETIAKVLMLIQKRAEI
jgi:hypothetical protein